MDLDNFHRALLTLLDRVALAESLDDAQTIAAQRFELAREYGFTVEIGEPVTGQIQ